MHVHTLLAPQSSLKYLLLLFDNIHPQELLFTSSKIYFSGIICRTHMTLPVFLLPCLVRQMRRWCCTGGLLWPNHHHCHYLLPVDFLLALDRLCGFAGVACAAADLFLLWDPKLESN